MIEITYAFVAEDHRAVVRVLTEPAPIDPKAPTAPLAPPVWRWNASMSSKRGVGGSAQSDASKPGLAKHQDALAAGIASLADMYKQHGLPQAELDALTAQV